MGITVKAGELQSAVMGNSYLFGEEEVTQISARYEKGVAGRSLICKGRRGGKIGVGVMQWYSDLEQRRQRLHLQIPTQHQRWEYKNIY